VEPLVAAELIAAPHPLQAAASEQRHLVMMEPLKPAESAAAPILRFLFLSLWRLLQPLVELGVVVVCAGVVLVGWWLSQ
jgi:hypothetical protein